MCGNENGSFDRGCNSDKQVIVCLKRMYEFVDPVSDADTQRAPGRGLDEQHGISPSDVSSRASVSGSEVMLSRCDCIYG